MDWKYLVPWVGSLVVWAWSVYTWWNAQKAQRQQTDFTRKENLYRELLRSLAVFYKDGPDTGLAPFLEQYRLAWLYAPDNVMEHLTALLESQRLQPGEKQMDVKRQTEVSVMRDEEGKRTIAEAVVAIRKDLFDSGQLETSLTSSDFRHYS